MKQRLSNRPWLREFLRHLLAGRFRSAMGFLGWWIQLRFRKKVFFPICRYLYRDPHRDIHRSILIAGTGRSGTTWLAEIIDTMQPFLDEAVELGVASDTPRPGSGRRRFRRRR